MIGFRKPRIVVLAPKCEELKGLFVETVRGVEVFGKIFNELRTLAVEYDDSGCGKYPMKVEQIYRKRPFLIIATVLSSQARSMIAAAEKYGVATIFTIASEPRLLESSSRVMRVCFGDDRQGTAAARFVINDLKKRRSAVFIDIDMKYSAVISNEYKREFSSLGGIVESFFQRRDGTIFEPYLKAAASRGVDVFFAASFPRKLMALMEQGKKLGIKADYVSTDVISAFGVPKPEVAEGLYVTSQYNPMANLTSLSSEFRKLYQKEWQELPSFIAALTFDAFLIAKSLYEEYGKRLPLDFIKKSRKLEGVTGVMEFKGSGEPRKGVVISKFEKGEEVFIRSVDV